MEATTDLDTNEVIEVVDTLAIAQNDLDAAQGVIAEVRDEMDGPHGDRLHTAVQALQRVMNDLEDGHATANDLLDALR